MDAPPDRGRETRLMRRSTFILVSILLVVAALPVCAKKKKEAPQPEAQPLSTAEVVAYVGEVAITQQEVDQILAGRLMKIRQQEYDLRRGTLDEVVAQRLLQSEADARGVSLADLMKAEVEQKSGEPTEAEIDRYYESNKNRVGSLKNKTREQAGPQVARILRQQKQAQRRSEFVQGLKSKGDVRIMLEPPRVEVSVPAGEPFRGTEDAAVTIVEFSDYQCSYCRRAEATVVRVMAEYGDRVRLVYRDYPLSFHQRALPASMAARCAGDQDKYWEYHDNLLNVNFGQLADADLKQRAQSLELDMAAFTACYDSNRYREQIQAALQDGSSIGVTGTPTFFINGRMMVGAKPYAEFKDLIEEELDRAARKEGGVGG